MTKIQLTYCGMAGEGSTVKEAKQDAARKAGGAMNTESKHTPDFKIKLVPMPNHREMITLDCAQQIELGELYDCTSCAEKRALLRVNELPDLLHERDELRAALETCLAEIVTLIPRVNAQVRHNLESAANKAKAALLPKNETPQAKGRWDQP